jgi:YD repeat-containing protein
VEGTRVASRHPRLTGIVGGRRLSGDIELQTANLTKRFTNIRGDFYLTTVTDRFGNSLNLRYAGTRVSRISSQNGRYVDVVRDPSGRIVSMRDDAGRRVEYQYDPAGRLYSVRGNGAGQWRYRYDANGHLQAATDPRGVDALTAGADREGRVRNVRVLYDVMSFSYQASATAVRNGLQQTAIFWHDESGLPETVQDFEGSTTHIAFDNALRPASLSFNGALVAELRYAEDGKFQAVRSSVEGRPRLSRFFYDAAGRLSAVVADDRQIAGYKYDSAGRVLRATDDAGVRSYEYFGATGYRLGVGETELDIETNRLGLMRGFSSGHQTVDISYNELDQVRELGYVQYRDIYKTAYEYATSGLRSTGTYTKTGQPPGPHLSLDYDVVGNLTNLDLEISNGARSSQTYVLGMNNQLTRLMNPNRADIVFEYDDAGRPTRRTLGANDVSHTFDALGRITAVYERGRKILDWRYGPMDVDAATEADDHTPWTAINEPVASAIFGSAESIAYARTRGTPFGPIRFSAPMARFVLATQLIPNADAVTLVSLQRRNVPLSSDHQHAGVGPAPLEFDRPSNALFLPPEFSSLNCYMCVGRFEGGGASMTINGSSGTPSVLVGSTETISITGSSTCVGDVWLDYQYAYSESGQTEVYLDFGDSNWLYYGTNASSVNKTVQNIHYTPGHYTVRGEVTCGCYWGGMWWDVLGVQRDVVVVEPSPACDPGAIYAALYNAFQTRSASIKAQYGMQVFGSAFHFAFLAAFQNATSAERSQFLAGGMAWTTSGVACYTYSCVANVQPVTDLPDVDVLLVDSVPAEGGCGSARWVGEGGVPRDEIRLVRTGQSSNCDNHRVETAYHEIGHLLGFAHITGGPDLFQNPRPAASGTRPIAGHHLRILVEKYQ